MSRRDRLVVAALVTAALALRAALALVIAPLQAPDEAAHLRYVETLGRTGRLPVQPAEPQPYWEQFYQPPLAYTLFVPVDKSLEAAGFLQTGRLRALRLTNAIYGALTVLAGYAVTARLTPAGDMRPILVAAVVAFFPGFAANASVLNNDALANLLAALLWIPLVGGDDGRRTAWVTGGLFGAACLAKLSVLALAPLLILVPLCHDPRDLRGGLRHAVLAAIVAGAIMLPWMLRNYHVYGDPLAIGVGSISFTKLAAGLPPDAVALLAHPQPARAFSQFWGHFGIFNNLHWQIVPLVLVPLAGLGLLGWVIPRAAGSGERFGRVAAGCAAAVVLAAAGLASFSLRYHAAWQGRYLYTATVPLALLLAGGWHRLVPARARLAFAAVLVVILIALDVLLVLRLDAFFSSVPRRLWSFTAEL